MKKISVILANSGVLKNKNHKYQIEKYHVFEGCKKQQPVLLENLVKGGVPYLIHSPIHNICFSQLFCFLSDVSQNYSDIKKNCQNKTYLSLFSSEFHDMFSRFFFVLLHIFFKHRVSIFHTSVWFLVIFTTKLQNQTNQG